MNYTEIANKHGYTTKQGYCYVKIVDKVKQFLLPESTRNEFCVNNLCPCKGGVSLFAYIDSIDDKGWPERTIIYNLHNIQVSENQLNEILKTLHV